MDVFGMRDKGICAMFSCLTVGVPRESPTEIDGRRFVKREREGIMREGEKDGGKGGGADRRIARVG